MSGVVEAWLHAQMCGILITWCVTCRKYKAGVSKPKKEINLRERDLIALEKACKVRGVVKRCCDA